MMEMAVAMTIKMGMLIFGIESLLRLLAYDAVNTVANDGSNPANAATAVGILDDIKREMAMAVAHEAMTSYTLMVAKDDMNRKREDKKGGKEEDWSPPKKDMIKEEV